jgi:hypothetical protein
MAAGSGAWWLVSQSEKRRSSLDETSLKIFE